MKVKYEILRLRSEGKTYKEIKDILNCSKSTISYHCGSPTGILKGSRLKECKVCKKVISSFSTYCSASCQKILIKETRIEKFNNGKLNHNRDIKKCLIDLASVEECSICHIKNIWNNKNLSLEVDHINGNSDDNFPNNLRLVCPNCHSQLETSKGGINKKKNTKRNSYLRKYKGYEEASFI